MKLNRLIQITAALAVVFAFTGCDEDFTEIGGEIISNPTDVELREIEVKAYSKKLNSVQTNNLNNYFLGVNEHPVYGESAASIVSQLTLGSSNPDFGENVVLDSVVLTLPYYSTQLTSAAGEEVEYKLDSVYGDKPFKVSIYETSYFLNDLDPASGFEQQQKYYSDQQSAVESNIVGDVLYTNTDFTPSAEPYVSYEVDEVGVTDTIANKPAFRAKLPVDYFNRKIIAKEGSEELLNNSNFKNYFRSLFIKAESQGDGGSVILFNLADAGAKITLYYKNDQPDLDNEDETIRARGSFDLNFSGGNRFNTYEGEFPENISQEIQSQDGSSGSQNLYVKSQEGSMAVVELFRDEAELEALKTNNWLINEANLTFYVNEELMESVQDPQRLLLYDLDNNQMLVDYIIDPTANQTSPATSRVTYGGKLETGSDANGKFYKIRITEHINRVLNNDGENVRLGLVITGNINNSGLSGVRRVDGVERVPSASLLTPRGTVLYGDAVENAEKRLKLNIYYTDLN